MFVCVSLVSMQLVLASIILCSSKVYVNLFTFMYKLPLLRIVLIRLLKLMIKIVLFIKSITYKYIFRIIILFTSNHIVDVPEVPEAYSYNISHKTCNVMLKKKRFKNLISKLQFKLVDIFIPR